ncbi:MAG TPA: PHP domain-containing protein [Bacteroidia bacterium]|nr:PHP domain-containing protein [Bacteroidia bacterium]
MIIDFHTHTHHSYDCMMKPAKILRLAKERGLDAIVINDHDTIAGGLECKRINTIAGLEVIVGAEIKTSIGDVTGLFLKEEITARNYSDVVAEIKRQGGITILNHPYVHHNLSDMNFDGIDLIEGYNGRVDEKRNEMAVQLAKQYNKPIIAGSDAHTYAEIANCRTHYADLSNLLLPLKTEYKQCSVFAPVKSQLVKSVKQKDALLMIKILLGAPRRILGLKK